MKRIDLSAVERDLLIRPLEFQAGTAGFEDVEMLQRTLNALGFDAGRPDGVMGNRTRSALRDFQGAYGVPVNGKLDPATEQALQRAINGAMERQQPVDAGSATREVQAYHHDISEERFAVLESLLNEMGYDAGAPDGIVTDATHRAIASFQSDHGMEATGLVDINTEAGIIEIHADRAYYGSDFDRPLPDSADVAGVRTWSEGLTRQDGLVVSEQAEKHHLQLTAEELKDVQMMLNTLGFEGGLPGTLFTATVHDAIGRFQKARGLPATSLVDARTLSVLAQATLAVVSEFKGAGSSGLPPEQIARYRDYAARAK